jgi:hypothetical protein
MFLAHLDFHLIFFDRKRTILEQWTESSNYEGYSPWFSQVKIQMGCSTILSRNDSRGLPFAA